MKRQIKAEIIAGSINEHGQKITTWVLTYPRFIHAECKTHRVISNDDSFYEDTSLMNDVNFSRNAASSRAIPALSMIADIQNDPFIPVAWQKEHKGMQGTEYITDKDKITEEVFHWLDDVNTALDSARARTKRGVTKQIANRPLEAYQWYTAIFTTTEAENFFNLRCPQYEFPALPGRVFKSKKEGRDASHFANSLSDLDWLKINKGQGEIHISLLAEAMWDSMNEYDYKQLKAGEWHIPFGDKFDVKRLGELYLNDKFKEQIITGATTYSSKDIEQLKIKIATARCARVSYNNFEGKDDYEADIKLYDILKASGHYSPFEHCARAMSKEEYYSSIRGELPVITDTTGDMFITESFVEGEYKSTLIDEKSYGWSGNFRGFVQLRSEL